MSTSEAALIQRLERHLIGELTPPIQKLAKLAFYTVDLYLSSPKMRNELRHDLERRMQRLFAECTSEDRALIEGLLGTRQIVYQKDHSLRLPRRLPAIPLTPEKPHDRSH